MLCSLVVPVYSQLATVLRLCKSLILNPQEKLKEVLLIDDASPDFILSEVVGSPFQVVRNEVNRGFVKTENIGAKLVSPESELLAFFNSDIEVYPQWLDPAVKLFEDKQVGVVGIKLCFPPGDTIQHAGCGFDALRGPYHQYLGWLASDPRPSKTREVSWVTGAALITRKDVFQQIGGFDENYGLGYFDDVDYCLSVKKLGYQIWYCGEASAIHSVGVSMGGAAKTPERQKLAEQNFRRNSARFHAKWDAEIVPDTSAVWVNY